MNGDINENEDKLVRELANTIDQLSEEGRAKLLFFIGAIDTKKFESSDIKIDDWVGADRKHPRATIQYHDGLEETVDIMKTVRENATSIGHPAILLAIRRWEHLILYNSALSEGGFYKTTDHNFHQIAKEHLTNIGKALIEGATHRALTKPFALLIRRALGTDKDYRYLSFVWELINDEEVKQKPMGEGVYRRRSAREKCEIIRKKLKENFYMWINLREPLSIDLQTSISLQERINMEVLYQYREPVVSVRSSFGEVTKLPIDYTLSESLKKSDPEIYLKPPECPYCWVKLSELLIQEDSSLSETTNLKIGGLIERSIYKVPPYGLSNREQKLAALLGHEEFASELPTEHFKKEKIDLIIDFLKSKDGSKYLSSRPKWEVFRTAFDSWRFGINKNTLRQYRKIVRGTINARKDKYYIGWSSIDGSFIPPKWLKSEYLLPDFLNEYSFIEIRDWLSLPLYSARLQK